MHAQTAPVSAVQKFHMAFHIIFPLTYQNSETQLTLWEGMWERPMKTN